MSVTRMAIPIVSMTQGFVVFLAFCYFACLFLAFFVLYVIFESWQHVPEPEDAEVSSLPMNNYSLTHCLLKIPNHNCFSLLICNFDILGWRLPLGLQYILEFFARYKRLCPCWQIRWSFHQTKKRFRETLCKDVIWICNTCSIVTRPKQL